MESQPDARQAAIAAGEDLLAVLRRHIDGVARAEDDSDDAAEVDRQLWEAVGAYGDALDELYGDEEESDEDAE